MYIPSSNPALTILLLLPLLTSISAQPSPPLSLCQTYFGPTYIDACCTELLSHNGPPCYTPIPVANLTDCTVDLYPRGWACCLEGAPVDPGNPDYSCGWSIDAESTAEEVMSDMIWMRTGATEKRAGMKRWLSALGL